MKHGNQNEGWKPGTKFSPAPAAVLFTAIMLSVCGCKGDPASPFFDPPGGTIDYLTSFSSFHLPGSFNEDYTWPIEWNSTEWEAVSMTLAADYTWERTVRIDYFEDQGGGEGQFKFTANAGWEIGFGASGTWGETTRGAGVSNFLMSDRPDSVVIIAGNNYIFRFFETSETFEVVPAGSEAGSITGVAVFDNVPTTPFPAALATAFLLPDSVSSGQAVSDTAGGGFTIDNLPAGDYAVELSADGYATEITGGITVADGVTDIGAITLSFLTGSITGLVVFEGVGAPPYPAAEVTAFEEISWLQVVETTSDTSTGIYELRGLPDGTYNIVAEAGDFSADTLFGLAVSGGEMDADTLFLESAGWEWAYEADDADDDSHWGTGNELYDLKAGYDAGALHLAFEFIVATNGIVLLLDSGDGSGVSDISGLDFFPRMLDFEIGFKAGFIFAGWSGESFQFRKINGDSTTEEVTDQFSYTGDPADGMETSTELTINWEVLFPGSGGVPPPGAEISMVLCLVGSDGSSAGDVCPDSDYPPGWEWNVPITLTNFLEVPVDLD